MPVSLRLSHRKRLPDLHQVLVTRQQPGPQADSDANNTCMFLAAAVLTVWLGRRGGRRQREFASKPVTAIAPPVDLVEFGLTTRRLRQFLWCGAFQEASASNAWAFFAGHQTCFCRLDTSASSCREYDM